MIPYTPTQAAKVSSNPPTGATPSTSQRTANGLIPFTPGQAPAPQPQVPTPVPAPGAQVTTKGPLGNFISNVAGAAKTVGNFLTGSEQAAGQDITAALPGSITGVDMLNKANRDAAANDITFIQKMRAQISAGKPLSPTQQQLYNDTLSHHSQQFGTAADLTPALNKSNAQVAGDFAGVAADVLSAGTYTRAGLVGDKMLTTGLQRTAPAAVAAVTKPTLGQTLKTIGKQTAANAAVGGSTGYAYDVSNNLHQGKTGLSALTPGIATAAGVVLPTVIGGVRAGVAISKDTAPRFINSLIKPKTADFSYGKDPGRTVSELGITGNSLPDFANNITSAKQDVGEQLGNIYSNPANADVRINTNADIGKIDTAISAAARGGKNNQTIVTQLQNIKDALLYEHGIDANGAIVKTGDIPRDLSNLSPQEAQDLIQHVADQTQFTGRPSDDKMVNNTLKQIYGGIREKINTAVSPNNPEVLKLNQQYADLTSAEIATRNRDKIVQRSNFVSLPSGGAAAAGAITAAIVTGGAAIPAILAGAATGAVEKAFESTAVKTRVASWLGGQSQSAINAFLTKNPSLRPILLKAFPVLIGKLRGNTDNSSNQ